MTTPRATSFFTVLLLEAGPDAICQGSLWPPSVQLPGGAISPEGALFDYHMVTTPQEGLCHGTQPGRKVMQPRGYILSGSSALNSMVWVRGAPAFYDEFWGDGWRFADVGPYFAKAEHYDHPERGALRGYDGPTSVMNAEDDELPKVHELFLEASEALSRENGDKPYTRRNRDYNDAQSALGASAAQWNIKNGIRESTAISYLTPELRAFENDLGVQASVGFWDQAGFAADDDTKSFARRRQTETKHGRSALLAAMGYITPELTGKQPDYLSPSTSLTVADVPNGLAAISKEPAAVAAMGHITPEIPGKLPGYLSPSAGLKFANVPHGLTIYKNMLENI
jgi:choline dehydrogenase-like flavoprotein